MTTRKKTNTEALTDQSVSTPTGQVPMYSAEYFTQADGVISWKSCSLKFGDALAGVGYAYGTNWFDMCHEFKKIFEYDPTGRGESVDTRYIDKQIYFLQNKKRRDPKRVLEIGGGRGEVANTLAAMGVDVVSVELSQDAVQMYHTTGKKFFGENFKSVVPVNRPVQEAIKDLDLSTFDTILMVESLEHIPKECFDPVWDKIVKEFHGRFITVNWPDYHPIWVGRDATPQEHCRVVDDQLFDQWSAQAKKVVVRWGSHLVLEF